MASHRYNIKGMVIRHSNQEAINDVRVEVWDKDLIYDDLVSSTMTADDGSFEVIFDRRYFAELFFDRRPDLFFKIFYGQHLICSTENKIWKNVSDEYDEATIELSEEEFSLLGSKKESTKKFKVSGRVVNVRLEGIADKTVIAYDVDLKGAKIYKTAKSVSELDASGGMEYLGRGKSSEDGNYSIEFTADKYKTAERGLADVVVYSLGTQSDISNRISSEIIGRSEMARDLNYVGNELKDWYVFLTDSSVRGESEYSRLISIIDPFTKESGLELFQLIDSQDQISFLASETGQDETNTKIAVQAANLIRDVVSGKFSKELFYGIGRQGIELSWVKILLTPRNILSNALKKSFDANIISIPGDYDEFITDLLEAAFKFSSQDSESTNIFRTLGFTLKEESSQKIFLQSYAQFKDQPLALWADLSRKGLSDDFIQSIQLTNQLSILTGGNTALIENLQVNKPPMLDSPVSAMSDLLNLTSDNWNDLIVDNNITIPDSIAGSSDEEKRSNYITSIQYLLNAAYPTKKIALMINNNDLHFEDENLKKSVTAFLNSEAATEFDISTSRITDFSEAIKNVSGDLSDKVTQHLQLSQRLYQVSPTPEAMQVLYNKGYTSAYHISSISQNAFINIESKDLGGIDIAFSVYNRARHQVMRAQHILLKVRDTQDQNIPSKIITREQQQAIKDNINNL